MHDGGHGAHDGLMIRVADLTSSGDAPFPVFVEREPRIIGPYRARFFAHATRTWTPAYRHLGEATALARSQTLPATRSGCRKGQQGALVFEPSCASALRRGQRRTCSALCDPLAARPTDPAHIPVRPMGNYPSRADPARGFRKSPPAPANHRNDKGAKPCSHCKSPRFPAQPGSAMTGLSRRRSRVRVPSLP
jgi:hypothetical protein